MASIDFEVLIRPVKKRDLERIVEIERKSFKYPWSYFSFKTELENPFSKFFVAEIKNEVIGYTIIWEFEDLHLANIAVHPDWRGKGIGSKLIDKIISYAYEKEISGITLEVRISNKIAQKFYEKKGFKKMGRLSYYYRDGEDAFVYRKDLR